LAHFHKAFIQVQIELKSRVSQRNNLLSHITQLLDDLYSVS